MSYGKDSRCFIVCQKERGDRDILLHFTIIGKAEIEGHEESRPVSTLPALKKLFPHLLYPPAELDGLIGLAVREPPQKSSE